MKSPTKQAKSQGDSGKEPKLPSGDRMEKKNLGRTQAQSGGRFSSGQRTLCVWLWSRQHYRSEVWLDQN